MTTTHGIDFRHGLVDISMSILGCECGESFSTVSSDLIASVIGPVCSAGMAPFGVGASD